MVRSNVPQDLLFDILVRLPVKSLLRFKLLNKFCNALIADHSFINEHLHFSNITAKNHPQHLVVHTDTVTGKLCSSLLLSHELSQPFIDLGLPFIEDLVRLTPYDHCNGIFCLYGIYPPGLFDSRDNLTLWNPATRESKVVPLPPRLPLHERLEFFLHGFGVDLKTNNYKVVSMVLKYNWGDPEPLSAEVYNLGTDSWKTISAPVPAFYVHSAKFRSYLNGVYHWLTNDHIVYGVLDYWYEIWDMNEYGIEESWSKTYTLGPRAYFGLFLGFWNDDEILAADDESLLVLHNIQTQQAQKSGIRVEPSLFHCCNYVESLVPLSV